MAIRSTAGSLARLINSTVRSMAPVFLKALVLKKSASSKVMPMAANTTAKRLAGAAHFGLAGDLGRQIWHGAGQLAEKMGSFCPLTRVFRPSMAETPVWINS